MSHRLSSFLAMDFLLFCQLGFGQQKTLLVAAASDLSTVGPELKSAFCKGAHTCPVRLVNGSSAVLAQQIGQSAQFDLFLSANAAYVDQLASNGKIVPARSEERRVGKECRVRWL